MFGSSRRAQWLAVIASICLGLGAAAPASARGEHGDEDGLAWTPCGDAPGVECATQTAPLDYDRPDGRTVRLAVARVKAKDPDHRIGSLLFNFGGPGGAAVGYLEATAGEGLFDALNQRFDIVAFDPRGVGQSSPSIDCKVNQETQGVYAEPFATPFTADIGALADRARAYGRRCLALNGSAILAHVSTAEVARDIDALRALLGDRKLTYLGFSYGTFLGTTYGRLFPRHVRALVLDGPIDADEYQGDPSKGTNEQTAAFERAFGRFLQACAADQAACAGFGGGDPWDAYDQLVEQADASPIPAAGYTPDPRPITGDDLNAVSAIALYSKSAWPLLASALAAAQAGDGSVIRQLVDEAFYGRDPDTGTYDPFSDQFVAILSAETKWPRDPAFFAREGDQAYGMFDHFYFNHGYSELTFGLWPVRARDAYFGPYRLDPSTPTPLVVATRYDPATPYRGALKLMRTLGNARLLTMRGDGHTAYGGNSQCIDERVNAYLIDGTLPPAGTTCRQEVPFAQPVQAQARSQRSAGRAQLDALELALHRKPLIR